MFSCSILSAQQVKHLTFSHPLSIAPMPIRRTAFALPETTHVLAVMVDFQKDNTDLTTGTGSFDFSPFSKIVDSPPHDKPYFQDHLTFVENYFRKVSDGHRIIAATMLDSVFHLSHQMQYYSPPSGSSDNKEIGLLLQETWHMVDSLNPGFPFHQYDAFLVFHAGVGRDIDFVSIYGYDPTPYDIPSLYVNLAGLQKIFGNSYPGIVLNNGNDTITNSLIIPETEDRNLSSIGSSSLLELGINGLLAANFGSHFGLPDLFDTQTGASGIGRFGLMDGQSIFSWDGVFPPEPSAWERYFLGWIQPLTISSGDTIYNFPAISLSGNPDSVYQVLISAKEYFLVENRNRDANRDGATVALVQNGTVVTKTWMRDTVGFNAFAQDSLYGVVTDVDEFDWSLPGGVDSQTGELFDGGMLIWHIDENVIDANIAIDAVNANPARRGVNLMEADGSQDIGQTYSLLDPGYGSEDGTPLDFWYAGNAAPLRMASNVFSPTSFPSSRSNNQADSHIFISGFSVRGPRMSARIQIGDNHIQPLAGFPKDTKMTFGKNSLTVLNSGNTDSVALIIATNATGVQQTATPTGLPPVPFGESQLFGWHITDGSSYFPMGNSNGLLTTSGGIGRMFVGKVAVGNFQNQIPAVNEITLGAVDRPVLVPQYFSGQSYFSEWTFQDQNGDNRIDSIFQLKTFRAITTAPVVSGSFIVYGAKHGTMYIARYDSTIVDSVSSQDSSDVVSVNLLHNPQLFIGVTERGTVLTNNIPLFATAVWGYFPNLLGFFYLPSFSSSAKVTGMVTMFDGQGTTPVITTSSGLVYSLGGKYGKVMQGFPVSTNGEILNAPAIADIDGDGKKDIVVFSGNKIYAINDAGSILDNFPITVPSYQTILSSPVIADVNGDGSVDIVAVTQEGLVVAYDKTGKMLDGFPLQTGINGGSTPAIFLTKNSGVGIAVASDDGYIYAWQTVAGLPNVSSLKLPWPQYLRDERNTSFDATALSSTPFVSGFFPAGRTYNWPNPVGKENAYKTH
ncbi:MAG TPA: FG-GAP-like repeat-containing protein, partial [Bacteroidota bacterium]|nr:FG-GAP-like repeat-containing protein [Bacteroidota bacterium]